MRLLTRTTTLDFKTPLIMGILNATPDSFSDGGHFTCLEKAVVHGRKMIEEGAHIIDIGGESSRPGATPVSAEEEIKRVIPLIKALRGESDIPLSIDTTKGDVAKAALDAGATIVNDIRGGEDDTLLQAVADTQAGLILMHMRGNSQNMQDPKNLVYTNIIDDIYHYFTHRIQRAVDYGVAPEAIAIDPGIGFAKTPEHNIEILANLHHLKKLHKPLLLGASRKSFIGKLCNVDTDDRLPGSLAALSIGIVHGADIIRVHDVKESVQAARISTEIARFVT